MIYIRSHSQHVRGQTQIQPSFPDSEATSLSLLQCYLLYYILRRYNHVRKSKVWDQGSMVDTI